MAKPLNHTRRLKLLEQSQPQKPRDEAALGLARRGGAGAGRHVDRKKQASREACRGRYV